VNAFVSSLNTLNPTETIGMKEETAEKKSALLKEYRLDAESRKLGKRIEVTTSQGTTVLYLGIIHPIGDSSFGILETSATAGKLPGKLDDSKVFLIPSFFRAHLEHDLTHWRDKKLLALGVHEIESYQYQGQSQGSQAPFSAERKEGQWILHSHGETLPGDSENNNNFLTAAVFLTAKNFISDQKTDAKAKAALKGFQPKITLTLQREKGSAKEAPAPITLVLYSNKPTSTKKESKESKDGKVYATVSQADPLFEVDANSIERLTKTLKDLRLSKLITSLDRFSTKQIELSGTPIGSPALTLTQVEGKWVDSADKAAVANDKVQDFLDKLSGNRVQEFLTGAAATAAAAGEKNALKVTFGDEKSPKKRELLFWEKDSALYGRDLNAERKEVLKIDTSIKSSLPWKRDFFKVVETPAAKDPLKGALPHSK